MQLIRALCINTSLLDLVWVPPSFEYSVCTPSIRCGGVKVVLPQVLPLLFVVSLSPSAQTPLAYSFEPFPIFLHPFDWGSRQGELWQPRALGTARVLLLSRGSGARPRPGGRPGSSEPRPGGRLRTYTAERPRPEGRPRLLSREAGRSSEGSPVRQECHSKVETSSLRLRLLSQVQPLRRSTLTSSRRSFSRASS